MTSGPMSQQAYSLPSARLESSYKYYKDSARYWARQLLSSRLFGDGKGRKYEPGFWVNRLSPSRLFGGNSGDATVHLSRRTTAESIIPPSEPNSPRNTPPRLSRFSRARPPAQPAALPEEEQEHHQQQGPRELLLLMQPDSQPLRQRQCSVDAAAAAIWGRAAEIALGGDTAPTTVTAATATATAMYTATRMPSAAAATAAGAEFEAAGWKTHNETRSRHHLIVVQQDAELEFYLPLPPSLVQLTPRSPTPYSCHTGMVPQQHSSKTAVPV